MLIEKHGLKYVNMVLVELQTLNLSQNVGVWV